MRVNQSQAVNIALKMYEKERYYQQAADPYPPGMVGPTFEECLDRAIEILESRQGWRQDATDSAVGAHA